MVTDYLNANKLPQDHPCVIETIKRHYLNKPSPPEVPLQLDSDDDKDRSPGQTAMVGIGNDRRMDSLWNVEL